MAYNAKVNWQLNDTVNPEDLNRMEQGIKDNDTNKLGKTENAASATKLATKRTINVSDGVTGTAQEFDGTQNINIPITAINPDKLSKATPVNKGGTGKTSITAGKVLVGNGTGTPTEVGIDNTAGGTANSTDLITSGAVRKALTDLAAAGVTADTANKLKTPRKISVSGALTSTPTDFDGTADIQIPVTAINPDNLSKATPVSKGGTGATTVAGIIDVLGVSVSANRTISVSTSGNDTTGNGTASAPFRTINKALSVLPKHLNGKTINISIAPGTYAETVLVENFSGGIVILSSAAGSNVTFTGLTIQNSLVQLSGMNLTVGTAGIFIGMNGLLLNAATPITVSGAPVGVTLRYGAKLEVSTTLTINGATTAALLVQYNSSASIRTLAGTGNNIGINVLNSVVHCQYNNISATIASGIVAGQIYS